MTTNGNNRAVMHHLSKHHAVLQDSFSDIYGQYTNWRALLQHMMDILDSQMDVTDQIVLLQSASLSEALQEQRETKLLQSEGLVTALSMCQRQRYENLAFALQNDLRSIQDCAESTKHVEEKALQYIRRQEGLTLADIGSATAQSHPISFYLDGLSAWRAFFGTRTKLITAAVDEHLTVSTASLRILKQQLTELTPVPGALTGLLQAGLYRP